MVAPFARSAGKRRPVVAEKNEDMNGRLARQGGARAASSQDMTAMAAAAPTRGWRRSVGVLWLGGAVLTVATAIIAKQLGPVSPMAAIAPPQPQTAQNPAARAPATQDQREAPAARPVALAAPAFASLAGEVEPDTSLRWFNGRPVRPARTITMKVTAYSADAASCYPFADGQTATLHSVDANGGFLVAADTDLLPFGTMLSIEGYNQGKVVPVLDRGGAIKGNRLDLLFPSHEAALEWGVKTLDVVIWEYADGKPAIDPRKQRS